jgi:hypothetical protein
LDEEQIRKYAIWQEKREKRLEAIQGELFDQAFHSMVRSHLPGAALQATTFGGGS